MKSSETFFELTRQYWRVASASEKYDTICCLGCAAIGAVTTGFGLGLAHQGYPEAGALTAVLGSSSAVGLTKLEAYTMRTVLERDRDN